MLLDRRTALRAALAAVVVPSSGCTGRSAEPDAPDPTAPLREAAAQRERGLIAAYDDAISEATATAPAAAALLASLRADHAAHLAALVREPPPTTTTSTTTTTTTATPTATTSGAPVPAPTPSPGAPSPRPASMARLAALEREAAGLHAAACLAAPLPMVALLADLAACEASHAAVLVP